MTRRQPPLSAWTMTSSSLGSQRLREIAHLRAIDEEADVAPYPVLLVDHAEADAGIAPVQVGEHGGERGAVGLDLAASV